MQSHRLQRLQQGVTRMKELSYQKLKKICLENTADVKTIIAAATEIRRRGLWTPTER